MRRLVTALASLAVVFLLIPSIGLAIEPPVDNGMGVVCIYNTPGGTFDINSADNVIVNAPAFVQHRLYFVMYHAVAPSGRLGAAAFSWRMDPPAETAILTVTLPPNTLNIGTSYNLIMGFGPEGLAITDGAAVMATIDVLFLSAPPPTLVYLGGPTPGTFPGMAEYLDFVAVDTIVPAYPNSVDGDYDLPVFGFNYTIATETQTWGGVKALFE